MKVQRLIVETMKIKVYTKAPVFWSPEEWKMTPQEREKVGIKLIEIEYNTNMSAQHPEMDDDIVRPILKNIEPEDKEPLG